MRRLRLLFIASISVCLILILSVTYITSVNLGQTGILYSDYGKFYQSARFVLQDKDIYTPIFYTEKSSTHDPAKDTKPHQQAANLNPPIFTLLILPLSYLSYATSLSVWSLLSIVGSMLSVWLLLKNFFNNETLVFKFGFVIAFFIYYPTFAAVQYGQLTLVLLPLMIGAWLASRNEQSQFAAVLLGIAASVKPFFGLFLIYFLLRREWRAAFIFAGIVLISLLIPVMLFGTQVLFNYQAVLHEVQWASSNLNISLFGFLLRLFGGGEANVALIPIAGLINKIYLPLCGLLLFLLSRQLIQKARTKEKCDIDFSATIIVMLLISPLCWTYYLPFLIVPLVVLWRLANKNYYSQSLLFLIALLIVLTGFPQDLIPSQLITAKNALPVFLWSSSYTGALLLLFGLFVLLPIRTIDQQNNKIFLGKHVLLILLAMALLPSFIGIIKTLNTMTLYSDVYKDKYHPAYFGH